MTARHPIALAAAAVLLLAVPPLAGAATARDPADSPGPLDLVKVKVGQKDARLKVRIGVSSPLPRLRELRPHPAFEKRKAERYLCLNFAAHSIGRRLYCPAGSTRKGRIDVGVSVVGKQSVRGKGKVRARIERSKRGMVLELGLEAARDRAGQAELLGVEQLVRAGVRSRSGTWRDDLCRPCARRGRVKTEINPVRRVGCTGVGHGTSATGRAGTSGWR